MASIINSIVTEHTVKGAEEVVAASDNVTKAQTRQANASSSAGRLFAAQSQGLGGIVGVYAGAAATIISITSAFNALAKAAKNEEVIKGTSTLASQIGESGTAIIAKLKEITNGQLSVVEAATAANTALSAGFDAKQLEGFASVATKASKVLGRDLSDSFDRLVKGSAKLEPELLDELGIFTRIEPAVQKYAASVNRSVSSLTEFERRQAFANAAIAEGKQKFDSISVNGNNAQSSLERLAASFSDLTQKATAFIANFLAPIAEFFSKTGNLALLFGAVTAIVFSKLKDAIVGGLGTSFDFITGKLDNLVNKLQKEGPQALENFNKRAKEATTTLTGTGAIGGIDPKAARTEGAEIRRLLKDQNLSISGAQQGVTLVTNRIANFGQETDKNKQQLKGLNEALDSFNSRLEGTNKFTKGASTGVSMLSSGFSALKDGIGGIIGRLGQFAAFVGLVQFLGQLAGVDVIGKIGEQFSKIGEAAAKQREEVEKLTNAVLNANNITTQYANTLGASKEEQDKAAKAAADAAEEILKGSIAAIAAGKSSSNWVTRIEALKMNSMAAASGQKFLVDNLNDSDMAYKSLTKSIDDINNKGRDQTAQDKLTVKSLESIRNSIKDVGVENAGLLNSLNASGISYEAATQAVKGLTVAGKDNADIVLEFSSIYEKTVGNIYGFSKANELLGKSFYSLEGASKEFYVQLSKGVNSESLSKALVTMNTRLVEFKTQLRRNMSDEELGSNKAVLAYEARIKKAGEELSALQSLEKINKDIQSTFSGALAAADKLQVSGAINKNGAIAVTPTEQKANQMSFLEDIIKKAGDSNKLEQEGIRLTKLKEENLRQGNISAAEGLDKQILALGLDSKRLQELRNSEAAQKALTGMYVEMAQEAAKLLVEQVRATKAIEGTARIDQLQQELSIQENSLTVMKAMQDNNSKLIDLDNQRLSTQRDLAITIANSKQSEIENNIKLIGLQQELLSIESRRAEATMAASNAIANRKDQQALLAAERKQNELAILGNLASDQQIRDADLAVARVKFQIEMNRISREEALVNTKASFELKAIDLKEQQLKEEQNLNAEKQRIVVLEAENSIKLLEAKKAQDDLADRNRKDQMSVESDIADKTKEIALTRAQQSQSERDYQRDILSKQVDFLSARSQVDEAFLKGLATFLEGEARIVALRNGESDAAKITEKANELLAKVTTENFKSNAENLQANIKAQRAASDSIYATEVRNAELTRTLKKTLGDEELAFLAKKQGISTQIYELEIQKIVESTAAKLNSLDTDKKITDEKLGAISKERDIVKAQALEKLTNLGIEKDRANEIIALAEKKYQLESQGLLKMAQIIKGAIENNLNKGVDSFFDAIKNGTLTLKTFRQGVVSMFRDIFFDIAKEATKAFITKPISDAIGNMLASVVGKETAAKLTGSAVGTAGSAAGSVAGATTGQCGCITDALSKAVPAVGAAAGEASTGALKAATASTGGVIDLTTKTGANITTDAITKAATESATKAATKTVTDMAPDNIYSGIGNTENSAILAGASGYTPSIPNISGNGGWAYDPTRMKLQDNGLTSPSTESFLDASRINTYDNQLFKPGMAGTYANQLPTDKFTNNYIPQSGIVTGVPSPSSPQTMFPGRNPANGAEYTPGPDMTNLNSSVEDTAKNIKGLGDTSLNTTNGMQGVINASSSQVTAVAAGTAAEESKAAGLAASEGIQAADDVAQETSTGFTEAFSAIIQSATASVSSFIASLSGGGAAGAAPALVGGLGEASGGLITGFSNWSRFAGGGVNLRDSVPSLLQPGEFVMKKSSVDSIGQYNLERMNATGKSGSGANIKVQVENQGSPKEAEQGQTQMDGETAIVKLILKDLNSNGPIRRTIRGNM